MLCSPIFSRNLNELQESQVFFLIDILKQVSVLDGEDSRDWLASQD